MSRGLVDQTAGSNTQLGFEVVAQFTTFDRRIKRGIGILKLWRIPLVVGKKVLRKILKVSLPLRIGKTPPNRKIQGSGQLLLHLERQSTPRAGPLDLLVGQLLGRSFNQIMMTEPPGLKKIFERLRAKVAFFEHSMIQRGLGCLQAQLAKTTHQLAGLTTPALQGRLRRLKLFGKRVFKLV